MTRHGPIVIVDDDPSDYDVMRSCITDLKLNNETRWFKNGQEALDYLLSTQEQPFIILADIMMPLLNGLELLKRINENAFLTEKAIPFVYITKAMSRTIVQEAYRLHTQGFFEKPDSYERLRELIHCIVSYWCFAKHPNNV
jgi:CheY-like chemotaxis protein